MEQGKNPRDIKLILARIITKLYHGEEGVKTGEEYFEQVFKEGEIPEDMPVIKLEKEQDSLASVAGVLANEGLVSSASEFRRLIKQGGVQLNREKVMDIDCILTEQENVLKIGKKKFVRLVF